ncbi:prepilin-type N-terminal cleavage/methylation domain-containing protein [Roseateles puraquae]|uniref:General secretion pathway protein GspG n=1 Tax=Roseateles puraquae TaxID=431059 RepID=A0A254N673_9BURK|nr:prepilin-type N-terminal cleavage/methylation domain-containing protein [Roseateles puraquae]OWQ96771.1 hypothetical protein CDO81_27080 [Roseateles puraquae]
MTCCASDCRYRRCRGHGFTVVELLVVLTVMAVLASMAMPLARIAVQREREQELKVALREIRAAIDAYQVSPEQLVFSRAPAPGDVRSRR